MQLSLGTVEVSELYLVESVKKYISSGDNENDMMFSIIMLAQSLELTIKGVLEKINPVFIYENIDERKATVSITKGIERLLDPKIGGVELNAHDVKRIKSLIKKRNEITHHQVELNLKQAKTLFSVGLVTVLVLQSTYLDSEITEILDRDLIKELLDTGEFYRLGVECGIEALHVLKPRRERVALCPLCDEEYCIIEEGSCVAFCYCCFESVDFSEISSPGVFYCECCNSARVEEPKDMFNLTEPDFSEGRLVNNRPELIEEYSFDKVCKVCWPKIELEVQEKLEDLLLEEDKMFSEEAEFEESQRLLEMNATWP